MSSSSSSIAEVIAIYEEGYLFSHMDIAEGANPWSMIRLAENYRGIAILGVLHRSSANVHY